MQINVGRRVRLLGLALILCLFAGGIALGQAPFPQYDIDKTCHDQSSYAYAATLGQVDTAHEFDWCAAHERETRERAQILWQRASDRDQSECAALADGRYARLSACFDNSGGRRSSR